MSSARRRILELLSARGRACTVDDLAAEADQHHNTVRTHLDGLIAAGLVERESQSTGQRGRPFWVYRCTEMAETPVVSEYAALASVLAEQIIRHSDNPRRDALAAGHLWAEQLDEDHGEESAPHGQRAAKAQLVSMIDSFGFAPNSTARGSELLLTRCPVLAAARRNPDVICGVHEGLLHGWAERNGLDPDSITLEPFAGPGFCRVRIG